MDKFMAELERLRENRELSQEEFSAPLYISQASYSRIVRGEQGLTLNVAKRIIKAYPEMKALFLSDVMRESSGECDRRPGGM